MAFAGVTKQRNFPNDETCAAFAPFHIYAFLSRGRRQQQVGKADRDRSDVIFPSPIFDMQS
jgi:hypothetical protein